MAEPIVGSVAGHINVAGADYLRIVLSGARKGCGSRKPLELLLPTSSAPEAKAILRESPGSSSLGPSTTVYGTVSALPPGEVRTLAASSTADSERWLDAFPVKAGEIGPVVLGYHERLGLEVIFKAGDQGAKARNATVVDEAQWVCRNRLSHALMIASYPLAAAFDVATSPIQLIIILIGGH